MKGMALTEFQNTTRTRCVIYKYDEPEKKVFEGERFEYHIFDVTCLGIDILQC